MNKTFNTDNAYVPFPNTNQLQKYFGLGRASCVRIGEQAHAKITIGRRVIWDMKKIEKYLESITAE